MKVKVGGMDVVRESVVQGGEGKLRVRMDSGWGWRERPQAEPGQGWNVSKDLKSPCLLIIKNQFSRLIEFLNRITKDSELTHFNL